MIDLRDADIAKTESISIGAVRKNGYALIFVENQTEAICMEAVKQNGYAVAYVENQTETICMEAVKQNGFALEFVRHQTEAICMQAVAQNGGALQFVENHTEAICVCAIRYGTDVYWRYSIIKYPSPQLITILLKLYPLYASNIMTPYATILMKNYSMCSVLFAYIEQHTNDLLYKPNNVKALVSYAKWHTTGNAKTIFLFV